MRSILSLLTSNLVLETVKNDLSEDITRTQAIIESQALPNVIANASLMLQLFQNLVGNALKYHRVDVAPQIRITAEYVDGASVVHPSAESGSVT